MTEIEQLQLQHKCEQVEELCAIFTFMLGLILIFYSSSRCSLDYRMKPHDISSPENLNNLPGDVYRELFKDVTCKLLGPMDPILRTFDAYLSQLPEPFKKIATKLTKDREETSFADDLEYLKKLIKPNGESHGK